MSAFASALKKAATWFEAPRIRRFDAAGPGRGWGKQPPFGRISSETLAAAAPIRGRARAAYANNPHARAAVEALVTALAGTGARATPRHPDPDQRNIIGAAFDEWADEADMAGRSDWWSLQADIVRAMVIDGEALLLMIDTPDGLRLRQIPAELLDESETRPLPSGEIVGGVEFDTFGRRVAYWIRDEAPGSVFTTWSPARRIDAADVLHIFKPIGPGQVRGISWLAPVLVKLGEIDGLSDALLMGFRVAALHAGFIKNINDQSGDIPFDLNPDGMVSLEPGTLRVLPHGYDISFSSPVQAQQAPEFLSAEIRMVAVGMGVPAHLVSGDLSKANYGSLRADLIHFKQRVEANQYGVLAPQLLRPVFARATTSLILAGTLNAPDFEAAPRDWLGAEFIMPAQPWIDPAKDAAAARDMIAAGLKSRRQAVAELGWSVEALDAEIAADRAREAALGLAFVEHIPTPSEAENANPDA